MPPMSAAFIPHTSSRCEVDSSEKMQLRSVHSPDFSTCGSYPNCSSLCQTASCRALFVCVCCRISPPRVPPTLVATSCSESALSAPDPPADRAEAIIEAGSAYRVCGTSTENDRDETQET